MSFYKESVEKFRDLWDRFARRSSPIQESWNKGDFPGGFPQQWENDSVDVALTVASVFACVRIIAGSIATVPFELIQDTGDRKKKRIVDEPEAWLFADGPNDETTSCEYFETLLASLLLNGNGFNWTPRDGKGRPKQIWNLEDHRCEPVRRREELIYQVSRTDQIRTPYELYQGWDMWHLKRYSFGDGLRGMSTLKAHSITFDVARSQQKYTKALYDNSMVVGSVVESDQPLDDKEIKRIERMLDKKYQGAKKAGRPLILPHNLKYKDISMTPEDAQMIENFNYTEKEISKIFGVPLHMISNLDRATFSNIEQQQVEFVQNTLRSWAVFIERSARQHVLNSQQRNRGWQYRFNLDELTRGVMKDRYQTWNVGIQGGFLTPNEAREAEDLDALEGLDEPLSPLNMQKAKDRMAGGDPEDPQEDSGEDPADDKAPGMVAKQEVKAAAKKAQKKAAKGLSRAERALVELVSDAAVRSARKACGVYQREGENFDEARAIQYGEREISIACAPALAGLVYRVEPRALEAYQEATARLCVVYGRRAARETVAGVEPDLTGLEELVRQQFMSHFNIGEFEK